MKFAGVIALFVAVATAAPILGDVTTTVTNLVKDPAASVAQVEGLANMAVSGAENAVNGIVGGGGGLLKPVAGVLRGVEATAGKAVGGAESAVNGAVGQVGGLVKPVTGVLGGLAGGVLKH